MILVRCKTGKYTVYFFICHANGLFLQPTEAAEEDIRNEENVEARFLEQVRYISSRFSSVRTAFLEDHYIVFVANVFLFRKFPAVSSRESKPKLFSKSVLSFLLRDPCCFFL